VGQRLSTLCFAGPRQPLYVWSWVKKVDEGGWGRQVAVGVLLMQVGSVRKYPEMYQFGHHLFPPKSAH
jgi:hypothetical protein